MTYSPERGSRILQGLARSWDLTAYGHIFRAWLQCGGCFQALMAQNEEGPSEYPV